VCTEAVFGSTCVTIRCETSVHRGHWISPLQRQPISEPCMSCLSTSWTHGIMTSSTHSLRWSVKFVSWRVL